MTQARNARVSNQTATPQCKRPKNWLIFRALCAGIALAMPLISSAADKSIAKPAAPEASGTWQKPAWLKELSLGVHESNDSNIFAESTGKLANNPSWLTTISPKLGLDFAPLFGNPDRLQAAAFAYAPDFAFYHNAPDQAYSAHRFVTGLKGKEDPISYTFDNAFTYIDGNDLAPLFPQGRSAYGTAVPRERLLQMQDRSSLSVRYDANSYFVRPTASLLDYDMQTQLHNPVRKFLGYQNYVDRYDANGGLDLGYKMDPTNAVTLGYRYGHQYQQAFSWDASHVNATNDYQRLLAGYEGKPTKWLTLQVQAGPDFRRYVQASPLPQDDKKPLVAYAEGAAIAEWTASDTLTFKYKRWNWVSSVGKASYTDTLFDLSYCRKLTSKLSLQTGARAGDAYYQPAAARDDWDYTLSAGLRYAFTANLCFDLSYAYDWGINREDGLPPVEAHSRQFERQVISTGAKWQF